MAKEFSLVMDPNPTVFRVFPISSQAYQVGDLVAFSRSTGVVVPATSTTIGAALVGVVMSAQVSSDIAVLVALVTDNQTWQADNTNATNVAHDGQRMVLTDKGTVNNTGTDSTASAAVWTQTGVVTATRSAGQFNLGGPTS